MQASERMGWMPATTRGNHGQLLDSVETADDSAMKLRYDIIYDVILSTMPAI
jgi:hypothetical protein